MNAEPATESDYYSNTRTQQVDVISNGKIISSYEIDISPDEFLPTQIKPRNAFQTWPARRYALPVVTLAIIISVLSLIGWNFSNFSAGVSAQAVFGFHEYWRLFTALFMHGDTPHLLSNLLPFLFFGWLLYSYFGISAFPIIPFVIGIASNALTITQYDAKTILMGASGMIYGMIGLWLVLYLKFDSNSQITKRFMRAVAFALIMLLPRAYEPNVSYLAHASGFSLGVVSGVAGLPFFKLNKPDI